MKKLPLWLLTAAIGGAMQGCVDNGYDLSNIDTTVRIEVNDLQIPVKLDVITLHTLFDTKDDDSDATIRVVDGSYAAVVDGTFKSDPITVAPVTLAAKSASPVTVALTAPSAGILVGQPFTISAGTYTALSYSVGGVSSSIHTIDALGVDWTMSVAFALQGASTVKAMELRDFTFQFPKGLTATPSVGTYDSSTGRLTVSSLPLNGTSGSVSLTATRVDANAVGLTYDYGAGSLALDTRVGVVGGSLVITDLASGGTVSNPLLQVSAGSGTIAVSSFSGKLDYRLDGFDISTVGLGDLPDLLAQEQTNIALTNPQIYLALNNPLATYGATTVSTGFRFTPLRNGTSGTPCEPDTNPVTLTSDAATGEADILMAPSQPSTLYPGYKNPQFVAFSSLSNLLSGEGIPSAIRIEALSPSVNEVAVKDFRLGTLGSVDGRYTFYAPLQLAAGSKVIYSGVDDDWGSEDLDDLTINSLKLKASVTSTLPFDVDFDIVPLDREGNALKATVTGAHIASNTKATQVNVTLAGPISGLDGIRYEARASVPSTGMNTPLAPTLQVTVSDVHIVVDGYYQKEL